MAVTVATDCEGTQNTYWLCRPEAMTPQLDRQALVTLSDCCHSSIWLLPLMAVTVATDCEETQHNS